MIDHEGTRTLNLLIRSQTPYPLGHAADGEKEVLKRPYSKSKKNIQRICFLSFFPSRFNLKRMGRMSWMTRIKSGYDALVMNDIQFKQHPWAYITSLKFILLQTPTIFTLRQRVDDLLTRSFSFDDGMSLFQFCIGDVGIVTVKAPPQKLSPLFFTQNSVLRAGQLLKWLEYWHDQAIRRNQK